MWFRVCIDIGSLVDDITSNDILDECMNETLSVLYAQFTPCMLLTLANLSLQINMCVPYPIAIGKQKISCECNWSFLRFGAYILIEIPFGE